MSRAKIIPLAIPVELKNQIAAAALRLSLPQAEVMRLGMRMGIPILEDRLTPPSRGISDADLRAALAQSDEEEIALERESLRVAKKVKGPIDP